MQNACRQLARSLQVFNFPERLFRHKIVLAVLLQELSGASKNFAGN